MITSKAVKQFNQQLVDYQDYCLRFSELLTQEQQAIVGLNQAQLTDLLLPKQQLLDQLDELQQQISFICVSEFECEPSAEGLNLAFKQARKQLTNTSEMQQYPNQTLIIEWQQLWQNFMLQAKEVEQKNILNGQLLNRQSIKNQLLISMLRGQPKHSEVYGQDGRNSPNGGHQDLGRA